MTIVSIGYDTTTEKRVTEIDWAKALPRIGGSFYGVDGANDWKVSAVAGQDRTVSISVGAGWGHGVHDTLPAIDGNFTLQLDPILSGSRWDLVACRRSWQATGGGPTAFVKVGGSATKEIPAGRINNPGVQDDQPLALVQVTAGSSQPTAVIDLRCWASNGGLVAADDLARTYLDAPGARVLVGSKDWAYLPGANGTFEWVDLTGSSGEIALWYGAGSKAYTDPGTKITYPEPRLRLVAPGRVEVEGMFKPGTSTGGIALLSIPTSLRPTYKIPTTENKPATWWTGSKAGAALAQVRSDGTIAFYGIDPLSEYVVTSFGWFL